MKDKHKQMYMRIAKTVAQTSSAKRLRVGSVAVKNNMVIATAYNGLPSCLDGSCENTMSDGSLVTKPEVQHSERNLILNLAKSTESSVGTTVFCTHSACRNCAMSLIDAGITRFIYETDYRETAGLDLLRKAGIVVEQITLEENS